MKNKEFQEQVINDLAILKTKLENLPCKEHKEKLDIIDKYLKGNSKNIGLKAQVYILWSAFLATIAILIKILIK